MLRAYRFLAVGKRAPRGRVVRWYGARRTPSYVAAIAESTLDDLGLCWPREVAPADVHVVAVGTGQAIFQVAGQLVSDLAASGVRVLYDDRADTSAGVKFKDAELIGIPTIVVVGRGLDNGTIEVRDRRSGTTELVAVAETVGRLVQVVGRDQRRD